MGVSSSKRTSADTQQLCYREGKKPTSVCHDAAGPHFEATLTFWACSTLRLGPLVCFVSWTGQSDAQRHPKTLEELLHLFFISSRFSSLGRCLVLYRKESRILKKKRLMSLKVKFPLKKHWWKNKCTNLREYRGSSSAWNTILQRQSQPQVSEALQELILEGLSLPHSFFPLFHYFH